MSSIKSSDKLDNTPPTKRQIETLEWIVRYIIKKGYAPSIEEVGRHFKISISSAYERIERLKRKQYLMKWKNAKRGMDFSDQWDRRIDMKRFFGLKDYKLIP